MQKHASFSEYRTQFEPLSPSAGKPFYFDPHPVVLPAEEISFLHYHRSLEIGICRSGCGLFLSRSGIESVHPGDLILFPPGISHYSRSLEPDAPCFCQFAYFDVPVLFRTLFSGEPFDRLMHAFPSDSLPSVFRAESFPDTHALLCTLLDGCFSESANGEILAALRLAEFFLQTETQFASDSLSTSALPEFSLHSEDPILRAEAYLAVHYDEPLSSASLAALCNLSESQFRRRFHAVYGCSPMAYLHHLRCQIGSELLLHSSRSVADVAEKVGYQNPSDFYRHFTRFAGISPSTYRERSRKK